MTVNDLRQSVGWSQSRFAKHFEIPVRTIQKWEIGQAVPRPYIVKMMYDLLVFQGYLCKES